jgi:hypothetical protein
VVQPDQAVSRPRRNQARGVTKDIFPFSLPGVEPMLTNWLRALTNRARGPREERLERRRPRRAFRPAVELLEQRVLLSTYYVNTTDDVSGAFEPGGPLSLREAVGQANANPGPDIIYVPGGTYALGMTDPATQAAGAQLTISDDVQIIATGPVTVTSGFGRAFNIAGHSVTLQGLTIRGGQSDHGGAVAITGGADVTLYLTTFDSNQAVGGTGADGKGGAVYIDNAGGTVRMSNDTFTNNSATGGSAVQSFDPATGANSFVGARSGYGGAVYITAGDLEVQASTFANNVAKGGDGFDGSIGGGGLGGALCAENGATFALRFTSFQNNSAVGGSGGGGADLAGAGGDGHGGAVSSRCTTVSMTTMSGCTFSQNTASGGSAGGAEGLGVQGGIVSGPGGSGRGGAIDYRNFGPLSLGNDNFTGNTAQGGSGSDSANILGEDGHAQGGSGGDGLGGAVYAFLAPVTADNSTFALNGAFGGRGGSATGNYSFASAAGRNGDGQGGAVYARAGLTATDSTFSNNGAFGAPNSGLFQGADGIGPGGRGGDGGGAEGGAVYLTSGDLTVTRDTFTSNTAFAGNGGQGAEVNDPKLDGADGGNGGNGGNAAGGAISSYSHGTLTFDGSTFRGNLVLGGRGGRGGSGDEDDGDGETGGFGGNGGDGGSASGGALALTALNADGSAANNSASVTDTTFVDNKIGGGDGGLGGHGGLGGSGTSSSADVNGTFHGGPGGDGGNGGDAIGGAVTINGPDVSFVTSSVANNEARAGWGADGGLGGPGSFGADFAFDPFSDFFGSSPNTDGGNGGHGGSGGNGGSARGGGVAILAGVTAFSSSSVLGNGALGGFAGDGLQGGNGAACAPSGGTNGSGGNGGNGGNGGAAQGGGIYAGAGRGIGLYSCTVANNGAQSGGSGTAGIGGGPAGKPVPLNPGIIASAGVSTAIAVGGAEAVVQAVGLLTVTTTILTVEFATTEAAVLCGLTASLAGGTAALPFLAAGAIPVAYYGIAAIGGGVAAAIAAASGDDVTGAFLNTFATILGPTGPSPHFSYDPSKLYGSDEIDPGAFGLDGKGGTQGIVEGGGVYDSLTTRFAPILDDTIVAKNAALDRHFEVDPFQIIYTQDGIPTSPLRVRMATDPETLSSDLNERPVTSNGRNLVGVAPGDPSACGFAAGDQTGTPAAPLDAGLWPAQVDAVDGSAVLAYYPGPAAVGKGGSQLYTPTDQLGQPRDLGGAVDLGAVQVPPPAVTINQAAGQDDPTGHAYVHFTVVFSQPMALGNATYFPPASAFQVGGTAGGAVAVITSAGDNQTFDVAVGPLTQNGTVTLSLPPGAVTNLSGLGNTASTSTDNSVTFLLPVASLAGPLAGVPHQPLTFILGAADVSADEQAAGFNYTVDWGDGTAGSPDVQVVSASAGNDTGLIASHAYAATGTYTAQLWATDHDGTRSAPAAFTTTVSNVVQRGADLLVGGDGNIQLTAGAGPGSVLVTVNGQATGPYAGVTGGIAVYDGSGNNTITVAPAVTNPVTVYAGTGTNTFTPGGGSYTFVAAPGQSPLTVTAANATRYYGQANPTFTASYSGFLGSDGPASLGGTLTETTSATAASAPGSSLITPAGLTSATYSLLFVTGTLTINPASLSASAANFSATAGAPFSGTVATFTNADPFGGAASYTAVITWGDGSTSIGTVSGTGSTLTVTGSHTYADPVNETARVTISHKLGYTTTATVTDTATVTSLGLNVAKGMTGGVGFWNNKNGQALINSFNGGSSSTALAAWLATTFPNLCGAGAGANNLAGQTNAQVAAFYQAQFALGGNKVQAQTLAVALNVYATTSSLGGSAGAAYGFTVSATGLGARLYNVGTDGAAFGVANNTTLNVYELLLAVNKKAVNGVLDGGDTTLQAQAADLFNSLNQSGSIG